MARSLPRRQNMGPQSSLCSLRKEEQLKLVPNSFTDLSFNIICSSRSRKWSWFSLQVFGKSTFIGLAITFFAGVCFSLFSPAFNLATNDQWHTLNDGVPHLVVYTAFFYFSVSCFVLAIILNITFLYYPVLNLPKTSFKAYLNDWNGRGWAFLAGLLCGFGNGLQFMGGQAAGYAAADAVQVGLDTIHIPCPVFPPYFTSH